MQLKFRIILNVKNDVLRDIIVDSSISLIEFSNIISSEFGFDSSEISTFHHTDENCEDDTIKMVLTHTNHDHTGHGRDPSSHPNLPPKLDNYSDTTSIISVLFWGTDINSSNGNDNNTHYHFIIVSFLYEY